MERPIGYWLKHLDRLIEDSFGGALAEQALSRRGWQVLNTLADTPLDESRLAETLRPFWGEGAVTLDEVTEGLTRRGWIARGADGRYAPTPEGQAARATVAKQVETIRMKMAEGVSEAEYQTTVGILRRMAENLAAGGTPQRDGTTADVPAAKESAERVDTLHLTHVPTVNAGMLIRRPVNDVFQAFVDPAITTKFWFTKSTGKMTPGAVLEWVWEMYGVSTKVRVIDVQDKSRILFEWDDEKPTTVELRFTPMEHDATYVEVTESGLTGDGDAIVAHAAESTGGFSIVLCALKALLEHNVALNAVLDRFPKGLEH